MINRIIEIKDLEIGDIVLVSGLDLRALEILRKPILRTKPVGWRKMIKGYKSIKCKVRDDLLVSNNVITNCDDKVVYFDFNDRLAWLIAKKNK